MNPFISICIPAYKNVSHLKRLLESISIQTFHDFEVIITDDSNDDAVQNFINNTKWNFLLLYFKKKSPLGSPENWNAAVSYSKGAWVKIMHHDDWFSSKLSLEIFVREIKNKSNKKFFFCSYENRYGNGTIKRIVPPGNLSRKLILKNPAALLSNNMIGPPSATIYQNDSTIFYDKKLQWLVDIDFYIRYLTNAIPFYIDQSLINVGIHDEQVTKYSFLKPEIEIPEHLIVLNKLGESVLKNIIVYDAFWRLIRNLKITSLQEFSKYNKENLAIPDKLNQIIEQQKRLPSALLAFGPFSKITMLFSYLLYSGN